MDAISSLATPTQTQSQRNAGSELSTDEFYKIMISEMLNQDPLEPMDNQDFLNQLTQLQTLESTQKLTEGIEAMLLGQQISSAGTMIGQQVSAQDANGLTINGVVERVQVNGTEVQIGVGDKLVPLSSVTQITAAAGEASP